MAFQSAADDIKQCTLIFQGKETLLEGCLENIYCYLRVILVPVGDLLGFEPRMIRTAPTRGNKAKLRVCCTTSSLASL